MASTPSPAAELPSTPPAPKFGAYEDNWEPYQPRKSARISGQLESAGHRTPSPSRPRQSTKSAKLNNTSHSQPVANSSARASRSNATKISESKGRKRSPTTSDMLPTPTKTPRRSTTSKQIAEMGSVSRNIFPSDNDLQLGDRSGRIPKKLTGSTLESFVAEDADQDFAIFNDSCNRIPEKDESNPFYNPPPAKPEKRQTKRKMVRIPGEGSRPIEEAVGRPDGMLMKFRGKTVYRQFAKPVNTDSDEPDELAAGSPTHAARPAASGQVAPRLLWPTKHQPGYDEEGEVDDEEATTDVEEMNMPESDSAPPSPATPAPKRKAPNAPKFAPFSPPSTQRTTRSTDKLAGEFASAKGGRSSQPILNYNKWGAVAKTHKSATAATKRAGEPLGRDHAKRSRTPGTSDL